MNIFDIIGPVMIGPSSSHTAGVVRIGLIAYNIFGETPKNIEITFYGSFAKTFQGHGSDKAIIGGLLGMNTSDGNIPHSLTIAKEKGINFKFLTSDEVKRHPNTLKIFGKDENGKEIKIIAESIGGGNILIRKINDLDVEIDGKYDTLLINHVDLPGMIKEVAEILFDFKINIANMKVYRTEKGGEAMMLIECDNTINPDILNSILKVPHLKKAVIIPKL